MAKKTPENDAPEGGKRKTRKLSRRHPILRNWPRGVFCPEAAGVVPGYPKTLEVYEQRVAVMKANRERYIAEHGKIPSRKGVPDGWAGRKREVADIREHANKEAEGIIRVMAEQGLIDDEQMGNEALKFAIGVVRAGSTYEARERLSAARLVLDFTRAKPASKSEVTVSKAEDFLAALAKDSNKG